MKASARDLGTVRLEQRYTDTDEKEYLPDYKALMPANAGKLTYDVSYEVTKGTASVGKNDKEEATGKLTYQISAQAGAEITWTFTVRSDNYEDSTFTLVVAITDRDQQENFKFENTTVSKTYGNPTFTVAATGAEDGSTVTYTSSDETVAKVDEDGKVTISYNGNVTGDITVNATSATYKIDAWTTLSGSNPSGNVQIVVCKTENGADHWLTQAELMALGLSADDFVVTTNGTKYSPVAPSDGTATVRYMTYDNTVGGVAALNGAGFFKVHFNVNDLAADSTISIAKLNATHSIVVG